MFPDESALLDRVLEAFDPGAGLMDLLPAGVMLVEGASSSNARVERCNAACARLLGASPTAGTSVSELSYAYYRPDRSEPLARSDWPSLRAIATGETVHEPELHLRRPDGEWLVLSASAAPLRQDGRVRGAVVVYQDVTAKHRSASAMAEEQLLASREELRALVERLNSVREDEKARLSRELHDEMGQILTALRMELEALEDGLGEQGAAAAARNLLERAVAASELVAKAIESTRNLLASLRPVALDRLGLGAALRQECRRFGDWAGVACEFTAAEELSTFGPEVDTALFRIAQEALTNVARHARASRVAVTIEQRNGTAVLRVTDDGRGIAAGCESAGLGMLGMRERAERLGGELALRAVLHGGTIVEAQIPLRSASIGKDAS
jgi:signal transduction histidine kinase